MGGHLGGLATRRSVALGEIRMTHTTRLTSDVTRLRCVWRGLCVAMRRILWRWASNESRTLHGLGTHHLFVN